MKKNNIAVLVLFFLWLSGCSTFNKAFLPKEEGSVPQSDGTTYKRSIEIGTGIDPQAKAIEGNLGYKQAGF